MIDYAAEPPTYPDGHVCNAWCRGIEHCAVAYGNPDYRADILAFGCAQGVTRSFPSRAVRRVAMYPEAPPSTTVPMLHRGRRVYPGHEDAYRYWFTYSAAVEAAVGA